MARVASFSPEPSEDTDDATRAQINYMPNKSHVIIIIITIHKAKSSKILNILLNVPFREPNGNVRAANAFIARQRNDLERAVHYLAARSDDN